MAQDQNGCRFLQRKFDEGGAGAVAVVLPEVRLLHTCVCVCACAYVCVCAPMCVCFPLKLVQCCMCCALLEGMCGRVKLNPSRLHVLCMCLKCLCVCVWCYLGHVCCS